MYVTLLFVACNLRQIQFISTPVSFHFLSYTTSPDIVAAAFAFATGTILRIYGRIR